MAVQPEVIRPPAPAPKRRRRRTVHDGPLRMAAEATPASEPQRTGIPDVASATAAAPGPSSSGWGGTAVLVVPTLGLLAMVAAVVFVNEVNHWWALVPAMLLALIATGCVMATITRMLADND